AGLGLVVHDPADLAARLAAHRDHVTPLPEGDGRVGHDPTLLEGAEQGLEPAHDPRVGALQPPPDPLELPRGAVEDLAIRVHRALDLALYVRLGHERL